MLLKRKGLPAQATFMTAIANKAFDLFDLQTHLAQRIFQLMKQYAPLPMGLADAHTCHPCRRTWSRTSFIH
jgi:uncharacterized protein